MPSVQKILVCGDVNGKLSQVFKRVATVNEKSGPFSLLLCVGEFFGTSQEWMLYRDGILKVPIPTYILGPGREDLKSCYSDMRGCELTENLIYLGPKGIYPCSNGLRIAYLGGKQVDTPGASKTDTLFGFDDIKVLEISAGSKPKIDILITSEWPKGVCSYAKGPDGVDASEFGSILISRLVQKLRPRYHFAGSHQVFYERLPYRNHEVLKEPAQNATRFIGLANVGNPKKRKWLYAFNTTPFVHLSSADLVQQPPDVTENPFPKDIISKAEKMFMTEGSSGKARQFFYDIKSQDGDEKGQRRKRKEEFGDGERPMRQPKPTGPCWFCLASPDVEKHLVVSVGTFSYLALAKGGLVPDHLLILPIEHFQSTCHLEEECRQEIENFKLTLKKMYKSTGKTVVFFERNYKTQHLQIQVVPLPDSFAAHLKETFMDISENQNINLDEVPRHSDLAQLASPGTPFFYVELPTGEKLFHRIKTGFPLQFGRELLACPPLLNIPERVDWRDCKLSLDEESQLRSRMREAYKPFDFTLEDEDND